MTNDYKTKILDWLAGQYEINSGFENPQFSTPTERKNNFETQFTALFPYGYFTNGMLQGNDANNNGVGYTIIYGSYYTNASATTLKGFIVILDEDFDIVQTLTAYSTGTQFGWFEILSVGDDGNFYGIELVNDTRRFVMLNNIIAKLPTEQYYKVVLRQSYNVQGQCANVSNFQSIIKAPNQSKYLIVGNDNNMKAVATELVVNVGSSNTWTDYTYTAREFAIGDVIASWNTQGNLSFRIAGFVMTDNINLTYAELTGNSTYGQTMTLAIFGQTYTNVQSFSVKMNDFNTTYFSITEITDGESMHCNMNLYHFTNGTIIQMKSIASMYDPGTSISLYKIGTEIFYIYDKSSYYGMPWSMNVGRIVGNNAYEYEIAEFGDHSDMSLFIVTKQFNLYNYFVQIGDYVYNTKQIYNSLNYNGNPYQALNSMVPNSAILFSGGVEVFARNLYNRIINNGTTISTIDVPNNFANNIEIDTQNLYGETNSLLITNEQRISTNVYEELLINFINTITMKNANNPSNIIFNENGASRINNSVSNPNILDYSNSNAKKYKINYVDDTYEIKEFEWTKIRNYYQAKIFIYVKKEIKNIQIISNDGATIYQTITKQFDVGNFYLIKQDMWTIEKEFAEKVYYDAQQVYYGNEEILY